MNKQTLVVAGLAVNVFSLEDKESGSSSSDAKKPVAILFMLHGRMSRADHMELVAKAFLDEVHARRKGKAGADGAEEKHDLWIVTFVRARAPVNWGVLRAYVYYGTGPSKPRLAHGGQHGEPGVGRRCGETQRPPCVRPLAAYLFAAPPHARARAHDRVDMYTIQSAPRV